MSPKLGESIETENAIHFESHTFRIFGTLACPAAFVSAWFSIEIYVTPCFWHHAGEKFCTSHTANSTLEFIINCQLNVDRTIVGNLHKCRPPHFGGDISVQPVLHSTGWPFCFCGNLNNNALPTLLMSRDWQIMNRDWQVSKRHNQDFREKKKMVALISNVSTPPRVPTSSTKWPIHSRESEHLPLYYGLDKPAWKYDFTRHIHVNVHTLYIVLPPL